MATRANRARNAVEDPNNPEDTHTHTRTHLHLEHTRFARFFMSSRLSSIFFPSLKKRSFIVISISNLASGLGMKVNDRPRGARARACVCVYVWAPPQGRPRVVTTNHHYPFFIITVDRYVHRAIRATDVPLRRSHAVLPRMFGTVPRIRNHRHVEDFADFQGSSQGQGPPHHLTPPVSARMFYIRVVPLCPFTLAAPLVRPRRFFSFPVHSLDTLKSFWTLLKLVLWFIHCHHCRIFGAPNASLMMTKGSLGPFDFNVRDRFSIPN